MKRASKIKTALFEAVFPSDLYCIRCGRIIDKTRYYGLCDKCSEGFGWVAAETCGKCGRLLGPEDGAEGRIQGAEAGAEKRIQSSEDGAEGGMLEVEAGNEEKPRLCEDCRHTERYFDRGYTCAFYGVYAREVIAAMKMKSRPWIGRKLGEAMAERMSVEDEEIEVVIPVPIHQQREKERGYNQAAVIARQFTEAYGRKNEEEYNKKQVRMQPLFLDALKRIRKTASMKGLDAWERKTNIEGAFELKKGMGKLIEAKTVVIIDDIYTTGATSDECARLLKEAGAGRVIVLTFAAGTR